MNESQRTEDASRATQLMDADGLTSQPLPADPMFEQLLADERRFEHRVRRLATGAWGLAFGALCLFALLFSAVRNLGDGVAIEAVRAAIVVVSLTGTAALLIGAVATVAWLFRSRGSSLRAIERRLAALERALTG